MEAQLYINGEFSHAASGQTGPVDEKATGKQLGTYAKATTEDIDRAVEAARKAQPAWAATSAPERSNLLLKFAEVLQGRFDELVEQSMRETGGVRAKAEDEVGTSIKQLRISAVQVGENAGDILPPYKAGKLSLSRAVPLGVIGLITPWNYPMNLAMRAVAPGLAFGNTVVLKPAELTPIIGGQVLAEAAHEAGFPPGTFNVVPGDGEEAGWPLATHPGLDLMDFTGSREIGVRIAEANASSLRNIRLELGGSNAFVILDDADIELAASCAMIASLEFQGQTCISASRHIVHRDVADAYLNAVTKRVEALKVGDPFDAVDQGPLISEKQRDRVHHDIVEKSIAMGAKLVSGGTYEGLFYRPTVLADVRPGMPAFDEEIFGPVIPVTVVDSEDEAIDLVNGYPMLMNSVFSADLFRGMRVAEQLQAGEVHVNDAHARHGADNQMSGFTKRQWIGVQRTPLNLPGWTAGVAG
ncbi:aldehyde dehydrogenase family protein [Kibdelosporangium philippinense]|uniref:Aldehyde dehydrogenase family protein n=1 Tax=Kibdelosporangium philippinense TaxID=211113 RepID=A0ABS8Z253_9PSEU|nr:aldehyde dehydrogenase family protein [Kibdelosporangium philippinense]MCE7001432.1 aldehyde dehydrogenase family protein [Kibdelosporangium philippinense]